MCPCVDGMVRAALARARMSARLLASAGVCLVLGLSVVMGVLAAGASTDAEWRVPPSRDFPLAGGNYANWRYSTLDKINTGNVKQLGGAWFIRLEEGRRGGQLDGTPVVYDGVMYVTTGMRNVLALDAKTGEVKWRYKPEGAQLFGSSKGLVVADGKVIFGRRDRTLMALDQKTGEVVWQTVVSTQRAAHLSAPPIHYDGVIFIGLAGGDVGARGQIGAYDIKTGKELWKFYTVPGPGERFADTWEGESYKWGGAGVWTHVALDPDLGMLYFGTGNAGPDNDGSERGGDNLFTSSLVALDMKTGKYRWHYQEVRHDIWDYDHSSPPLLVDVMYRGRLRKIVVHPGKTGWLYILDRTNGKPLIGIEDKAVPQEPRQKTARTQPYPIGDRFVPACAEPLRDFERGCVFQAFWDKPVLVFPGSSGGNAWAPIAFSPKTNLVYVPANVMPSVFVVKHEKIDEATGVFKKTGGGEGYYRPAGAPRSGTLTAMDPTTNKIVWQLKTKWPLGTGAGLLTTAGGLILHGEPDGNFVARDITNGEELFKFQTGAGVSSPAATYEVDGEQYVAVMSSGNRIQMSQAGDYLWALKLGGTVPPAPAPREPPTIHPEPGQGPQTPLR